MKAQTVSKTKQVFRSAELAERALRHRAVEAVIWGMPAVNDHLMYQEMVRKVKGGFNQVFYWSRLLNWNPSQGGDGQAIEETTYCVR